jgi:integrase
MSLTTCATILVLPTWNREEQPSFTVAQVKQIIDAANEPYKTVFWLVAETGIRRAEICGLNVGDVDLNEQAITVQRSRWKSKLKQPKNGKKRFFALSPQLTQDRNEGNELSNWLAPFQRCLEERLDHHFTSRAGRSFASVGFDFRHRVQQTLLDSRRRPHRQRDFDSSHVAGEGILHTESH